MLDFLLSLDTWQVDLIAFASGSLCFGIYFFLEFVFVTRHGENTQNENEAEK